MNIPRIMSTQHPDNVTAPFFSENSIMHGDDEVKEAFYAFSHLGAEEQLWDAEGKEVDMFVVKKLLSRYSLYFKSHILGKEKFLTLRVPNPDVEKNEGKILLEALHSIPRVFDLGKAFYHQPHAPVFEVVIPMCFSEKNLIRVHEYYRKYIIQSQHKPITEDDISVAEWLGELQPNDIRVTPLFETKDAILNADEYVEKYIQHCNIQELQRVWFARSDPALNYGSLSAVLLGKIGLQRLHKLQERTGIKIYPMLGCGSAPFRGNFTPLNVHAMLQAYPSMQTFTAQSAFKYDYGSQKVVKAIETIKNTPRGEPIPVDEKAMETIIDKASQQYQQEIHLVADLVNKMSVHVPSRRKRKLHTDLFGYARKQGNLKLPRAIKFCASLYSLGIPPDLLGLSVLTSEDLNKVRECYKTIDKDMADALKWYNPNALQHLPTLLQVRLKQALSLFNYEPDTAHQQATDEVWNAFLSNNTTALEESIIEAARIRRFLG